MAQNNTPKILTSSFLLELFLFLEKNSSAREAAKRFGMTPQSLSYHLKKLKLLDVVEKIGYGVWATKRENLSNLNSYIVKKTVKTSKKELKKTAPCRYTQKGGGAVVSGHAYIFVLKLPDIARWSSRRSFLSKHNISFRVIPQGESLDSSLFGGWRVWLCSRSVVFYAPRGSRYVSSDEFVSSREAFFDCLSLVRRLEGLLRVSFLVRGEYVLKPRREHNAHLDRLVASGVSRGGKDSFVVWDDSGVWLRVDSSLGYPELESEAGGSESRVVEVRDASRLVREDFNTLKDKGVTREFLLEQDARIQQKLEFYADHIKSHAEVMVRISKLLERFEGGDGRE